MENAHNDKLPQSPLPMASAGHSSERELKAARIAFERKSSELAQQREFFQVTLSSIGDAVISTDTNAKVTFLNPIAEEMTGWKLDEAVGQPLTEIFHIINEHTREKAANPVTAVLRDGIVIGLANHTALISRDGREIAIDDSAAPIRDAEGMIIGAVMVFHDVTEPRRIAGALAERARLSALRADVSEFLVSGESLPAILQNCAEALVKYLHAAFARIWTLNESENVLELQASAGLYTHLNGPHGRVKVGEFKIGRIAQNRRPLLTNDVQDDPNISDPAWAKREGMKAFAGYPMMLEDRVLGVLAVFGRHPFTEAVIKDLGLIADGISQWVQRKNTEAALQVYQSSQALLLKLLKNQRETSDPHAMMRAAVEAIGRHLSVDRVGFLDMLDENTINFTVGWTAGKLPLLTGQFPATAIGTKYLAEVRAGSVIGISDARSNPLTEDSLFGDIGTVSLIGVPIIRNGQWHNGLYVNHSTVRRWTVAEIALVRDIAEQTWDAVERARAQADLRESENRFRAIVTQATTGVVQANAAGVMTFVNQRWCEMLGYPEAELLGKNIIEVTDPEFVEKTLKAVQGLAAGNGSFQIEKRYRRKDGSAFWASSNVNEMRGVNGNFEGLVAIVFDNSASKAAEQALQESEERFRLLADNMSQLAWMAEANGAVFWYNQRWFDYTGTTHEEMRRGGWENVLHPEHIQRVVDKWSAHLQKGEQWEDTFPIRGRDSSYRWFLSRAFPVRDAAGKIVRWFGTNTDITDLRIAQDSLSKIQAELARQNQSLEQTIQQRTISLEEKILELEAFSYSITHDMRSPLRAMHGYSQTLLTEYAGKLDAQGAHYLERISRGAARLDLLIRDVLAYSRLSKNEAPLAAINLEAVIAEILQTYPQLHASRMRVTVEKLPEVIGHEVLLTQIVSNLLGNAAKFVAPGIFPEVRVLAEMSGPDVIISFADNGIGIDPRHHEQIFQIFGRVHPEKTYEGTGIGLAIVRKAAERMNGTVGVDSAVSKGSRFWIKLKRA